MDEGSRTKNTLLGTILSFVMLCLLFAYALNKYNDLKSGVDTSYQEFIDNNGIGSDPVRFEDT